MSESAVFLVKTSLDGLEELDVDGRPALDDFAELIAPIKRRLGDETASLFAEPIITRSREQSRGSISWYTSLSGTAKRLAELDAQDQQTVEKLLRHRLTDFAGLLDDPEIGPRLGAWLYLPSLNDVWVVAGQPVLINWAVVPAGLAQDAAKRAEHVAATTAPLAGLETAPALSLTEWRLRRQRTQQSDDQAAPSTAMPQAGVAGTNTTGKPEVVTAAANTEAVLVDDGRSSARWPLIFACLSAFLVLLLLLIPGVLRYPAPPVSSASLANPDAITLQREINRSLEEQVERLRRELDGASCTAIGGLEPPADGAPLPLLPPPSELELPRSTPLPAPGALPPSGGQADGSASGDGGISDTESGEPAELGPVDPGTDIATLQDLIDASVVLVIAPATNGGGLSTGTGFFIGRDTIVTNLHVVDGAQSVFVVNEMLASPVPVTVAATTGSFEIGSPDFAVLTGEFENAPPPIPISAQIEKLQDVIAPGFPGVIMQTDSNFAELLRNGEGEPPAVAAEMGSVTVIQDFSSGSKVVIHSADLSPGNSGGPLLDGCGRAVAVNTFVNPDEDGTFRRLNYSLHADELIAFLNAQGIDFAAANNECEPRRRETAQARQTAPPGDASTEDGEGAGDSTADDAPTSGGESDGDAAAGDASTPSSEVDDDAAER